MIYTCKHCSTEFKSYEKRASFCSPECYSASMLRASYDQLLRYALSGEHMTEICKDLGVSITTVKKHMRRAGLYEQWREMRCI